MTVVGFRDTLTVSSSAAFRSFQPTRCTEAPESTSNSHFSCFVEDGARKNQTSEGEKNTAFCLSLSVCILLAQYHASLRAHRSCVDVSSWQQCLILERRDSAHEDGCAGSHQAMGLSPPEFSCGVAHTLSHNRLGCRLLDVLEHATKLLCIRSQDIFTLSSTLLRPFVWLTISLSARKRRSYHQIRGPIVF